MIRTQIQLSEEQANRLREAAARRGVSMAYLIRESVDRYLADAAGEVKREAARKLIGRFRSGVTDLARKHDKYLEEAYGE